MPKREHESPETRALEIQDEVDLVCGACLLELFDPSFSCIGNPSGCPHLFHWDCLENWAQRQNTCPQCKNRFRVAGKYELESREFVECVNFKKRNRVGADDTDEPLELPVDVCEKCKEPGPDEELILCDGMDYTCNAMFHYRCVGFSKVPSGLWFCEDCMHKGYIPEELKSKSVSTMSPPKQTKQTAVHVRSNFPQRLLVQEGAARRPPESSSRVPRNLVLDRSLDRITSSSPVVPSTGSVFARFRQRRLAALNLLQNGKNC